MGRELGKFKSVGDRSWGRATIAALKASVEASYLAVARVGWVFDRLKLLRFDPSPPDELDARSIADFVFGLNFGAFAPRQLHWEFRWLVGLVLGRQPRTIVEVGTSRGGTLVGMALAAPEDATIISIDLPAGVGGSGYPRWKERHFRAFLKPKQCLHLVRARSQSASTVSEVRQTLTGRPIDLLLLDGDHSYRGVAADWDAYSPLLGSSGVGVLHDVVPNPVNPTIQVDRFWRDRLADLAHAYVVRDPRHVAGYGFGVVDWST